MWYQKRSAWAVFITAACLFAVIAYNVVHAGPLVRLDASVTAWLHAHGSPTLTQVMLFVTHAHDPIAIDAYSLIMAIILARRREWSWILGLAAAAPGGLLLNGLIKRLFERARPSFDDPLVTLTTFSFPSGHTAGAMLFYGTLSAYLLSRTHSPRVRNAWLALWLLMVIIVGFSRMYLGVHYLSDVLGGAAWSLAWLSLCLIGVRTLQQRSQSTAG
jgi:undecaprenyl-diphosphatase